MKSKLLPLFLAALLMVSVVYAVDSGQQAQIAVQTDKDYALAISLLRAVNENIAFGEDMAQLVTRGAFVNALISVLGVDVPQITDTGFSDVKVNDEGANSIAYAKQIGIIDNSNQFYPSAPVTTVQALKMALGVLGYLQRTEAAGGYPVGIIVTASQIGLTDNLKSNMHEGMSARDAAILLYNTLTADLMVQIEFGETIRYEAKKNKTILTQYHKWYEVEGIITATPNTGLTDAVAKCAKGQIMINSQTFLNDTGTSLLGYNVIAYYKEEFDGNHLVFAAKEKNTETVIDPGIITDMNGFTLVCTDEDTNRDKKYTLEKSYCYIKNGKAYPVNSANPIQLFTPNTGSVTLIDNNNNGDYDVALVDEYRYCYVSVVDTSKPIIYDENKTENCIDLSNDECEFAIYSIADGERYDGTMEDIKPDTLIAYTQSDDKMLYTLVLCFDSVSGTVTESDSGEETISIDGNPYKISSYFKEIYNNVTVNTNGLFLLGLNGEITVYTSGETDMMYGWIVKTGMKSGVIGDIQVKIFTQNNEMKVFDLEEKIKIDDKTVTSTQAKTELDKLDVTTDGSVSKEKFIRFGIGISGRLNRIDLAETASGKKPYTKKRIADNSLTCYYSASTQLKYKSSPKLFAPKFYISDGTYNFIIPPTLQEREEDDNYSVENSKYFVHDSTYVIRAYDMDISGFAGATLYFSSDGGASSLDLDSVSGIVEKVAIGVDEDGNKAIRLSIWSNFKYETYYSDSEKSYSTIYDNASGKFLIKPGDIVRFTNNSKKVITKIELDFSFDTYTVSSARVSTSGNIQCEYILGYVYGFANGYMNIITSINKNGMAKPTLPTDFTFNNLRTVNTSRGKYIFVYAQREASGKTRVAIQPTPVTDIVDYISGGEEADLVISRQRYDEAVLTIIYKVKYID